MLNVQALAKAMPGRALAAEVVQVISVLEDLISRR